jgi:adenylate kinase
MNLLLLGAPGSGKGTLANFIMNDLKLPVISSGNLLRHAVEVRSSLGIRIKNSMDTGELISDEIVMELVAQNLASQNHKDGYILDGFPRNLKQAEIFDQYFGAHKEHQIEHVVYLKVDIETILNRLLGRRLCPLCGTIYQLHDHPPKVAGIYDKDGTALVTRSDDQPETIRHRFDIFLKETLPLVSYYEKQGKLDTIHAELSDVESYKDFNTCLRRWKDLYKI